MNPKTIEAIANAIIQLATTILDFFSSKRSRKGASYAKTSGSKK